MKQEKVKYIMDLNEELVAMEQQNLEEDQRINDD
jgi:hypothetical protein